MRNTVAVILSCGVCLLGGCSALSETGPALPEAISVDDAMWLDDVSGSPRLPEDRTLARCFIYSQVFLSRSQSEGHIKNQHVSCPHCGMWVADNDELLAHHGEAHHGMPVHMSVLMTTYAVIVAATYGVIGFLLGA